MTTASSDARRVAKHNRRVALYGAAVPVGVILATVVNGFAGGGDSADLIAWLSFQSNLFGIVALGISCAIAVRSKRPLGAVDGVRIMCWWAVGTGVGIASDAHGYAQAYWGRWYLQAAAACGWGIAAGSLVTIVLLSLFARHRPVPRVNCCVNCGYPRIGLKEPRCPECGEPFRAEAESDEREGAVRPAGGKRIE